MLRREHRSHLMCRSGVEDLFWACAIHTGRKWWDWYSRTGVIVMLVSKCARESEWVCVCLPVRNVFVWVCAVFWEVASLQLTIVHLEKRKTILLGINECEQNHLCEVFWFTPYCGSQKITILPLVTMSYSWKYEWNARDTFLWYSVFFYLPFYFLIALLTLPLALECIYKLILTCFEQLWVQGTSELIWCDAPTDDLWIFISHAVYTENELLHSSVNWSCFSSFK